MAVLEPGEYLLKGYLRKSNSESTIEDDWTLYEVTFFGEQNEGKSVSNKYASTYFTKTGNQYVYDFEANVISDIQLDDYLTDYVKNTDYADGTKAGLVRTSDAYGTYTNATNGVLLSSVKTYEQYTNLGNGAFIGKGTLENVLTARIGDIQTLLDNLNNGGGVE